MDLMDGEKAADTDNPKTPTDKKKAPEESAQKAKPAEKPWGKSFHGSKTEKVASKEATAIAKERDK